MREPCGSIPRGWVAWRRRRSMATSPSATRGRRGWGGHAGLALSAHGRITPDSVAGYAFGVRASLREGSRWPARLLLRLDTDGSLRRAGFALGLSLGGNDLVGAVVTFPGDVSRPDAASLYGVSTRQVKRR